ncbi:MAG: RIP metalloprotease RseP [Opitutales bacterium]
MGSLDSVLAGLLSSTWGVVAVIIFLNGAIYFHELGHYLVARWRGLKVEAFSIFGIGPKIFGWKGKDGVEFCVCWLPIGAFVRLPQMDEMRHLEGKAENDPEALPPLSVTDKILVAAAGPACNIILGLLIALVVSFTGYPRLASEQSTTVGYVVDTITLDSGETVPSPAAEAGLQPGDKILEVDGERVNDFSDVRASIIAGTKSAEGDPQTTLLVNRNGEKLTLVTTPVLVAANPRSGERVRKLGFAPAGPVEIGEVVPDSPAEAAGLQPGDRIQQLNGQPVFSNEHLRGLLAEHVGEPVELTVERGESTLTPTVAPQRVADTKPRLALSETGETQAAILIVPEYAEGYDGPYDNLEAPAELTLFPAASGDKSFGALRTGDTLVSIGGVAVKNLAQVRRLLTSESRDIAPVELALRRGEQNLRWPLPADVDARLIEPQYIASIGFREAWIVEEVKPGVFELIGQHLELTRKTIVSLFSPGSNIGPQHLVGIGYLAPVIFQLADDIRQVLWFAVLLNINLAIINLLPIPPLDGGHILFAIAQKVRGKPLPPTWVLGVQQVFTILLLGLMAFVLYNDSQRLIGDSERANRIERLEALSVPPRFEQPAGD